MSSWQAPLSPLNASANSALALSQPAQWLQASPITSPASATQVLPLPPPTLVSAFTPAVDPAATSPPSILPRASSPLTSALPTNDSFNRLPSSPPIPNTPLLGDPRATTETPPFAAALNDALLEREKPTPSTKKQLKQEDPFKTKYRLVGYINEVCEALKTPIEAAFGLLGADKKVWGSKLVNPFSYNVVYAYSALDGLYMGKKEYENGKDLKQDHRLFNAASKGLDTLAFQYMASVEIPAFIVSSARLGMETGLGLATDHAAHLNPVQKLLNLTVGKPTQWLAHNTGKLLNRLPFVKNNKLVQQALPVAAALALIPLCIKPVDAFSHKLLDLTFRPASKWLEEKLFKTSHLMYEGAE